MDETTAISRLIGNSLHSSSSSTYIPFEIIEETILCRLPVNSLIRFRCVCKSWNSLISKDLRFVKKHIRVSPKRQHLVTTKWRGPPNEVNVTSCPFDSLNLHSTFDSKSTQLLNYSPNIPIISIDDYGLVASCDGIICLCFSQRLAVLYNPCIRKLHKLPYIDLPHIRASKTHYAFGYDPFIDNYKVVAILWDERAYYNSKRICETGKAYSYTYTLTLGTDSWKRIKDFPSMYHYNAYVGTAKSEHGIFMRGTVNWLTSYLSNKNLDVIVSLHLGKECYQEISLPDFENSEMLKLDVMRDCLCVFEIFKERSTNVWLMKEYGNKESWIKLICFGLIDFWTEIVYISEDDNHLLHVYDGNSKFKWVVYDVKNESTSVKKIQELEFDKVMSKVYVESLISP